MAYQSFFDDAANENFDLMGRPKRPGIYEFVKSDGRKIIYTLDFMERDGSEAEPRLKVVRASRFQDYPSPAHALKNLDGKWLRYLGQPTPDAFPAEEPSGPQAPTAPDALSAPDVPATPDTPTAPEARPASEDQPQE